VFLGRNAIMRDGTSLAFLDRRGRWRFRTEARIRVRSEPVWGRGPFRSDV